MYPITSPRHLLSYHRTPVDLRGVSALVEWALHGATPWRDVGGLRGDPGGGLRDLLVTHHGPQIADEFARDGDHRDLRAAPHRESLIHRVQALLRLPRVQRDGGRLSALPQGERRTDFRSQAIRPGRLHQDVATMRIAGFRNRPAALPFGCSLPSASIHRTTGD